MAETWLSQEAYDRLQGELETLKTEGRERISAEIEVARAHGDLRENAEYHTAKDEQGKMEARIRQLQELLHDARIGEPDTTDVARPGPDRRAGRRGRRGDLPARQPRGQPRRARDPLGGEPHGPGGPRPAGRRTVTFTTPTGVDVEVIIRAIRTV
jgi:transcription elongation factor GreA